MACIPIAIGAPLGSSAVVIETAIHAGFTDTFDAATSTLEEVQGNVDARQPGIERHQEVIHGLTPASLGERAAATIEHDQIGITLVHTATRHAADFLALIVQ